MHVLAHYPALAYATPNARSTPTYDALTAQPGIHVADPDRRQSVALSTRFDHGWLHETVVGGSSLDRFISSN